MGRKLNRALWVIPLAAVAGVLAGFNPMNGSEPLPTTVSAAQTYIRNMVYFHTHQYPDSVYCSQIYEAGAYYYKCNVSKAGYDTQLVFVKKG